ncbi:MAG: hypothetical protein OEV42_05060 [Deltaproteobacteria bacterium]|nr:hypothetical protein [Deltaproteobacteria bacterium]
MEPVIFAIILILSTWMWWENQCTHFNSHHPGEDNKDDLRWIFRANGIEPDEMTYLSVMKLVEEGNLDDAVELICSSCHSSHVVSKRITWLLDHEVTAKMMDKSSAFFIWSVAIIFPAVTIISILFWSLTLL